ncbi:unnamed protein product [Paramecium primaurelia]|uniref:Uncharacterized protein n=1 Tax=Paramecium primaurelia TaxID=5886 RepID=A0A8S1MGW1_PARPR|nr:unnamed protein product [Paramecium primaurelia]
MLEENKQSRDIESYLKNLITFDQYLIIQQESKIYILTKRVANEKLICDVLKSSTIARSLISYSIYQLIIQRRIIRDLDYPSENISSYLSSVFMNIQQNQNFQIQRILNLLLINMIKSRIEDRNQRIKMKNKTYLEQIMNFIVYLVLKNRKGIYQFNNNNIFVIPFLIRSIKFRVS